MKARNNILRIVLFLPFLFELNSQIPAQKKAQPPEQQRADDVIRVETELVQTDVTVVDKQNRLVSGLKPEQFELRVDSKPQPLVFFEQVTTGSVEEGNQLAAARTAGKAPPAKPGPMTATAPAPVIPRGRLIFFFVDDVHLANDSLVRARSLLLQFVQTKMEVNDRVAIVSTSGRIGFLQQLTDNKAVLLDAIARLNYLKRGTDMSSSRVPISEVDASLVANHGDRRLFAYLLESTKNEFQMGGRGTANLVRNRIRQINVESKAVELETLSRLESLIASTAPLPGRKLVFFISDGFIVDYKKSQAPDILRRVVNEAARVGVVIYSLDTRGTLADAGVDASRNDYPDFTPRQASRTLAEIKEPQEPLETLADETGGRSFLNPNSLDEGLSQAIRETSGYYLLAWRPDTNRQRAGKSRIDVFVKGHPELRVRMRKRFFDTGSNINTSQTKDAAHSITTPEDELRQALASLYPHRELPTFVSVGYLRSAEKGTAQGATLNVSMQLDGATLNFEGSEGKEEAVLDVLGVALDDRGSFASFKQRLSVARTTVFSQPQHMVQWNQLLPLPPGLYQVRVAVRDRQSGRTGSASHWIELPQTVASEFSLSSIFIGERKAGDAVAQNVPVKVDRNFAKGSRLRYQVSVYNATRVGDSSSVSLQVQVLRGSQTILTLPAKEVTKSGVRDLASAGDAQLLASIPSSGELELGQLPPGWYVLQITATDKVSKRRVSQEANFVVY